MGEGPVGGGDCFFFFPVTKMKLSKRLNLELIASYPVSNASLYPNADLV